MIAPLLALALAAAPADAAEGCDGTPSGTKLTVVVDRVKASEGLMAVTVYPDDAKRFLQHHGQLAVVRRPATAPSTRVCYWVPGPGVYAVIVYQDLNSNLKIDRGVLGAPAEPYGLSNDPPNLMGLPTFGSVRFPVHAPETTIHIPLHAPPHL